MHEFNFELQIENIMMYLTFDKKVKSCYSDHRAIYTNISKAENRVAAAAIFLR